MALPSELETVAGKWIGAPLMYMDAWELSVPTEPVRWIDLAFSGRIEDDTFGTTCGSYGSAEKAGADGWGRRR